MAKVEETGPFAHVPCDDDAAHELVGGGPPGPVDGASVGAAVRPPDAHQVQEPPWRIQLHVVPLQERRARNGADQAAAPSALGCKPLHRPPDTENARTHFRR